MNHLLSYIAFLFSYEIWTHFIVTHLEAEEKREKKRNKIVYYWCYEANEMLFSR